jgi:DNA-binding CsgD family transcriptional regulator
LALKIPPLHTDYNLWLNDKIILSNNYNYVNKWGGAYQRKSQIITFNDNKTEVRLSVLINRFSSMRIFREPLVLGTDQQVRERRLLDIFIDGVLIGVFLLIFSLSLLLWIGNSKAYPFLLLGFISLVQAVNLIGKGESIVFLYSINDIVYYKGQMLLLYLKLVFMNAVLFSLFKNKISKALFGILVMAVTALFCTYLFLPTQYCGVFLAGYYLFLLFTLAYYFYLSLISLKSNRKKALATLISTSFFIAALLIDAFSYNLFVLSLSIFSYEYYSLINYGYLLFVLIQIYYLYIINSRNQTSSHEFPLEEFAVHYGISGRELDVLRIFMKRYGYKEIALKLFVSHKTIETHVYHIYQKTGAKNKDELIRMIETFN